jgi:hypothetical protein
MGALIIRAQRVIRFPAWARLEKVSKLCFAKTPAGPNSSPLRPSRQNLRAFFLEQLREFWNILGTKS